MPRSKFLLVLALLLLLSIPATAVLSDGHGLGEGTATVLDDAGMRAKTSKNLDLGILSDSPPSDLRIMTW